MSQIAFRYFGDYWVLLYHPRYWRTCLTHWPSAHRTDDGWFVGIGMIEFGKGMAK
jgi:hypothetical protein